MAKIFLPHIKVRLLLDSWKEVHSHDNGNISHTKVKVLIESWQEFHSHHGKNIPHIQVNPIQHGGGGYQAPP